MVKKFLTILFLCLCILPAVAATNTEINIKTPPLTEVHLSILDADYTSIVYKGKSNVYGDVNFTHSGDEVIFDLRVILKQNDQRIYNEKFDEGYVAGKTINLETIPEGFELVETPGDYTVNITNSTTESNSTVELKETLIMNETLITNETGKKPGSGFSIFEGKGAFSLKTLYYTLGFFLLLGLILFTSRLMHAKKSSKIKVIKLSEVNRHPHTQHNEVSGRDSQIKDAENRIKKAQEEIDSIKKEQKINEIRERMERDKKEMDDISRR